MFLFEQTQIVHIQQPAVLPVFGDVGEAEKHLPGLVSDGHFYVMPFPYCNLIIPLTNTSKYYVRTNPDCAHSATSRATRAWGRGRGTGTPTRPVYASRRGVTQHVGL